MGKKEPSICARFGWWKPSPGQDVSIAPNRIAALYAVKWSGWAVPAG